MDFNSAESDQTVTGNVETNDTAGADGIASIAWTGAVGSTVTGAHGVLTVTADGTYSYHANVNTSGTDVFNYTITDGDGDTSPSTLTIDVTNGQPSVSPATATVNEAALDTTTTASDLGHGSVTGSNPSSTAETTTGTLTFSDPDVPVTVTGVAAGNSGGSPVSGNVSTTITGTYGLLQVDAAGHYTYTLTTPYTTSPPANNGPETEPGKDVFSFTVTDAFGNTNTSTISISIIDDVPTAPTVTVSSATVGVDETPGVQTTGGASDVLGSTAITFNGGSTTVAALFSGIANKGVDPDVSGGLKDNGALSFASSGASSIVSVGTLTYGADGPAASGSETFNLSLLKTTSNLTLTDGEAITLSQSGNMILGTVTGGGAFSGQVAYAITMDPLTGKVYVADYLSLHQDSLTTTPNDGLALTSGTIGVTVTLTDGDGDQVTSTVTDISGQISFFDDGRRHRR